MAGAVASSAGTSCPDTDPLLCLDACKLISQGAEAVRYLAEGVSAMKYELPGPVYAIDVFPVTLLNVISACCFRRYFIHGPTAYSFGSCSGRCIMHSCCDLCLFRNAEGVGGGICAETCSNQAEI